MVIVQETQDSTLSVRNMDARPSTVCLSPPPPPPPTPSPSTYPLNLQNTEGTVYQLPGKDVEGSPKILDATAVDPYDFRHAIKSEPELADLRKRKQGKLASYQQKQNEVTVPPSKSPALPPAHIFPTQLIESLLKPMEEHTEDARVDVEATRLPVCTVPYPFRVSLTRSLSGQDCCVG
jgi:hypothetical protein